MQNYYDILGISRNATEKEIKTAFRKLAAKHHPDKGGDHKKFVEIKEAYETLSDPHKRTQYDNYGSQEQYYGWNDNMGHGSTYAHGFDDILRDHFGAQFSDIFGQRRKREVRDKNKSLNLNLEISLKESYDGKKVMLEVPLPSGRKQVVDTTIPAGIESGMTVRLQGLGDDSLEYVPPGDILITVRVIDDKNFRREGADLYTNLTVSVYDLILGNKVKVNHISGKSFELNIPAGTQPNTTFSMRGQGMPVVNGRGIGTLYVTVKGLVPKNINEEHKNLITKAREYK